MTRALPGGLRTIRGGQKKTVGCLLRRYAASGFAACCCRRECCCGFSRESRRLQFGVASRSSWCDLLPVRGRHSAARSARPVVTLCARKRLVAGDLMRREEPGSGARVSALCRQRSAAVSRVRMSADPERYFRGARPAAACVHPTGRRHMQRTTLFVTQVIGLLLAAPAAAQTL